MIFRLSQKLNAKLKAGTLAALPLDENPLADWSSHLFTADRTRYVIVCNTKSLYSTVMYAKGITNENTFIIRALSCVREFMQDDGHASAYERIIAPASASVRFTSALNRSVTSSLNDLVYVASVWLTEGEISPHDVGFKLNITPFSRHSCPTGKVQSSDQHA